MFVFKLKTASVGTGAENTRSEHSVGPRLYWFKCGLNGQILDAVLDSAATVTCIARRCVSSSNVLSKITPSPYKGLPILDANEKPLAAREVIKVTFTAGKPQLSLDITVVIVDDLPYSCLVGTSLLSKLETW